jgi:hypothetical protein
METQRIHAAALKHGVAVQALDEVTASVQAHFGDETPVRLISPLLSQPYPRGTKSACRKSSLT